MTDLPNELSKADHELSAAADQVVTIIAEGAR